MTFHPRPGLKHGSGGVRRDGTFVVGGETQAGPSTALRCCTAKARQTSILPILGHTTMDTLAQSIH